MANYNGATCKGSYILGTSCGTCERCEDERKRIANQLRNIPEENNRLEVNNIVIYKDRREVYQDGEEISLSYKEFDLLEMLLEKKGAILTRSMVMSKWEDEREYKLATNIVDAYICQLRGKIGSKNIETVRQVGYKIRLK